MKQFFTYLRAARGFATARGAIMVLSAAYAWARLADGWEIETNPCHDLKIPAGNTDLEIFEPVEIVTAVQVGDRAGLETMADAVILALFCGQRPSDIPLLTGGTVVQGRNGNVIRLIQGKTGRLVEVPIIAPLAARLAIIANRKKLRGWTCPELIVNPRTGKGYTGDTDFNRDWRAFIAAVAEVEPSIAGKHFKYLRKTLTTWLDRAGNDDKFITPITGHSPQSFAAIKRHYLSANPENAAIGMARLEDWLTKEGIAV